MMKLITLSKQYEFFWNPFEEWLDLTSLNSATKGIKIIIHMCEKLDIYLLNIDQLGFTCTYNMLYVIYNMLFHHLISKHLFIIEYTSDRNGFVFILLYFMYIYIFICIFTVADSSFTLR